jgi:hypothetical protein
LEKAHIRVQIELANVFPALSAAPEQLNFLLLPVFKQVPRKSLVRVLAVHGFLR